MGKKQKVTPTGRKAERAKAGKRSGNVHQTPGNRTYRGTDQELAAYSQVILIERKVDDCMVGLLNLADKAPNLSREMYMYVINSIRQDREFTLADSDMPLYEQDFIMYKVDGLIRLMRALKVQIARAGKLVSDDYLAA